MIKKSEVIGIGLSFRKVILNSNYGFPKKYLYDDDYHDHDHDHDVDDADAPAKLRNPPQNALQIPYSENWVFGLLEGVKFLTGGIP
jgi:hypothetical protein